MRLEGRVRVKMVLQRGETRTRHVESKSGVFLGDYALSLTLGTGPAGRSCEWCSIDGSVVLPLVQGSPKALAREHALCLTGDGLAHLQAEDPQLLLRLIPHVQVFARVAPKQKVSAEVVGRRGPKVAHSPHLFLCPCRSLLSPA